MSRGGAQRNPQIKETEREERRLVAARAARIRRILILAGVAVVTAGGIAFAATRPEPAALAAIETFPDQGAQHIDPTGPAFGYNSNPPTSGSHAPQPAPCGIYRQEVPDVVVVHNLEHGAIVVRYDPALASGEREALEAFARDAGTHILVSPHSGLDDPIVLTGWTKMLRLTKADRTAIDAFYGQFAQNGPERGVPCPNQVDEGTSG